MRIFIIHGWGGHPGEGWFPWFKEKMEAAGHQVFIPAMPDSDEPKIEEWVSFLASQIGRPDENTVLIGHSIGCQAIMRYLESAESPVARAIFVAGWFTLNNLESSEEEAVAQPWLETPLNFDRIKENCPKIRVILSDNDPWVPLGENKRIFEEHLGASVAVLPGKGHLSGEHGVFELPEAVEILNNL